MSCRSRTESGEETKRKKKEGQVERTLTFHDGDVARRQEPSLGQEELSIAIHERYACRFNVEPILGPPRERLEHLVRRQLFRVEIVLFTLVVFCVARFVLLLLERDRFRPWRLGGVRFRLFLRRRREECDAVYGALTRLLCFGNRCRKDASRRRVLGRVQV